MESKEPVGKMKHVKRDKFIESTEEEPHKCRRESMLRKYPELKNLMGYEPKTKYIIAVLVLAQILVSYYVRDYNWGIIFVVAYVFGATTNACLFLCMHELSHGLGFKGRLANRWYNNITNLCMGAPAAGSFKPYHLAHHSHQGVVGVDTDVPSDLEATFAKDTPRKLFWLTFQLFNYVARPFFIKPLPIDRWMVINFLCAITFDTLLVYCWGWKPLLYFFLSNALAGSLHPGAGHFVAEHYLFFKDQETYSYYGSYNPFILNAGYHNEHHDFPSVPWSRLHWAREMAPEYYNLPYHTSYWRVLYEYAFNPDIGPYNRVVRVEGKYKKFSSTFKSLASKEGLKRRERKA